MPDQAGTLTNPDAACANFRCLRPEDLAAALRHSRRDTLATFDAYEAALQAQGQINMALPYSPELNPPLWELGHVGWFQEWWLARNPERLRGAAASPEVARLPATISC